MFRAKGLSAMPEPFNPYHEWLGISAGKGRPHHYQLLGIPLFEDAANVISNAADRQMAHLRTFQAGPRADDSQRLLNEVAAAKVCLLNPDRKAAYDAKLRAAIAQRSSAALPTARPLNPAAPVESAQPASADAVSSFTADTSSRPAVAGSRSSGRKQKSRTKSKGWKGPGTYSLVLLVIGIVGLAGVLWYQANFPAPATVAANHGATPPSGGLGKSTAAADDSTGDQGQPVGEQGKPSKSGDSAPSHDSPDPPRTPVTTSQTTSQPLSLPDAGEAGTADIRPLDMPAEPAGASVQAVAPVQSTRPSDAESGKTPIPGEAKQDEVRKLIEDLFSTDLAAAKKAGTSGELAKKFLKQADESREQVAEQYVLYGMARDVAAEAGETMVALQAIDSCARTFPIDVIGMKVDALEKVGQSKGGAAARTTLIDAALPLVEQAADAQRFDLVKRIGKAGYEAALANKDALRSKQIRARVKELAAAQKQFDAAHAAIDVLKQKPDDPDANLAVGRWYCLIEGDWPQGLPYLQKCGDPALADLANKEIAKPTDSDGQQKLADGWWAWADTQEDGAIKPPALQRARFWYEKALPQLTGLFKARVEKRLDSLPIAVTSSRPSDSPARPSDATPVVGEIRRFSGHFEHGGNGVVTGDGSCVLLIKDRSIRLVDLATGEDRVRFEGHEGDVYDARLSGDDKRVVSHARDSTIRVWNAATGQELRKFPMSAEGHGRCMVLSRDGKKTAFSTQGSHVLQAWDLEAGKQLRQIQIEGEHWVNAISLDGKLAMMGGFHNGVHIWDIAKQEKIADFDGHSHMYCGMFLPDDKFVFTGGGDDIRYFRLADGARLIKMAGQHGHLRSLAFSPVAKRLVSGHKDGSVVLWDPINGKDLQYFRGHPTDALGAAFTPDGRKALSSHAGDLTILWGLPP